MVIPGDYQVRLTVAGQSQTARLQVIADPRAHSSGDALQKALALLLETRDRITQLHQAVNQIRDLKSQIDSLHQRFAANESLRRALDQTKTLREKISTVEEQLIQVNMKGSEANLAFPNMLNEELDSFSHLVEQADATPTLAQYEVFRMLSAKEDAALKTWGQIQTADLPAVNSLVRESNIPVLTVRDAASDEVKGR
jgi:DNA repair exonuclease SbcCD ATPase subunit